MYELLAILAVSFSLILNPPKEKGSSSVYTFIYWAIWSVVFVTIAFRGKDIGRDTLNYINKYFAINSASSYSSFGGLGAYEPLFFLMCRFLGRIFGSWSQCIIIAEALVITAFYGIAIKRYSINPIISILAFLSLGLYTNSLCLLRQFMAMSFCVWSLKYVFEKKPFKFYFLTLIAIGFHYTAIFWLTIYFLSVTFARFRRSDWIYIVVAIVGYFFVDVFQEATSHIADRWDNYASIETGAEGIISFTIFFLITILAFINRDKIITHYRYGGVFLSLNYVNIIFWTMRLVTRNAERLALFFTIAPILLIPILCDIIEKKYGKSVGAVFKIAVVALLGVFFVYKYQRDAGIYPYRFMLF